MAALTVPPAVGLILSTNNSDVDSPMLGEWPAKLPFSAQILNADPPAYLEFLGLGEIGTAQQSAEFVRLISSEIQYLKRHPHRQGPGNMFVVRKFTDVAFRCLRLRDPGSLMWSFDLAIDTLKTVASLVQSNGVREYVFEVRGEIGICYETCQIYLKNP
ncbi:MAG: hypothetical protein Q9171_006879 [Xanthocarpia ochracea]